MHICADSSESLSHVVMKKCPLPQFFNRAGSQTLIAGRKSREREKERERESAWACTRIFCFGLFS